MVSALMMVEEAAEGAGDSSTSGNAKFRTCLLIGVSEAQAGIGLGKSVCSMSGWKITGVCSDLRIHESPSSNESI